MNEDRFVDKTPYEIYACLLDEGVYLCSVRTMYRILKANDQVRERRNVLRHPQYKKPELLATGPNQVWSWDITKVRRLEKWQYFYVYVMMDIFSRKVVGWMVATEETGDLGKELIAVSCERQNIQPNQLLIHADRGSPMTSKTVTELLADLDVRRSHNRPHVSNDNPFSESQFKTMKYRPDFPNRFGSIQDARAHLNSYFTWYNQEHRHSGIAFTAPNVVHSGAAARCSEDRQDVLSAAFGQNPQRFVKGKPRALMIPNEVYINPPQKDGTASSTIKCGKEEVSVR